ncbi:MAG: sigma-70 family RNA polymerase sigma factor [Elusimicrobiota bacterium]
MKFEELLDELSPGLVAISKNISSNDSSFDSDDMVQEMMINLMNRWKNSEIEGFNNSYILQSCWFHIKNHLRKYNRSYETLTLDEYTDDDRSKGLIDVYDNSDENEDEYELLEGKILKEDIEKEDLTEREKEVLSLTLGGYTLRETAAALKISFVRVHKILNNIKSKASKMAMAV